MRWPTTAAVATLAGVAAAAAFQVQFGKDTASAGRQARAAPAQRASTADLPVAAQHEPRVETMAPVASAPLPSVFDGTEVDGNVRVDDDGRVVPTRALRALFDYYLSGVGAYPEDHPVAAVKAQLRAYAHVQGLAHATTVHLLALFDRYMAYRRAAALYTAESGAVDTAQALRELHEMQIAYLGADMAEAFYGEQTRLTRAALARRRGEAGQESLSSAQRQALGPMQLAERVQSLRESGADAAAVSRARRQAVGAAAARRLAALDARRTAWDRKFEVYRSERAGIMASSMARADRRDALHALRHRHFSEQQIARVKALDRLAAQRAAESAAQSEPGN